MPELDSVINAPAVAFEIELIGIVFTTSLATCGGLTRGGPARCVCLTTPHLGLMTDLWLYLTVLSASVAATGLIFIWELWR